MKNSREKSCNKQDCRAFLSGTELHARGATSGDSGGEYELGLFTSSST